MVFKKIINDPYNTVDEMVDGIVLAHRDILTFANKNKRAVFLRIMEYPCICVSVKIYAI